MICVVNNEGDIIIRDGERKLLEIIKKRISRVLD